MNEKKYHLIDLSYLDLMADGDADMKGILLDMLLDEPPGEFEKMQQQADAQAWEDLKQTAHKMKSTLPYIGFKELTETNKAIDKMLWENQNTELSIETIEQEIPKFVKKVAELYQNARPELEDARNNLMNPV